MNNLSILTGEQWNSILKDPFPGLPVCCSYISDLRSATKAIYSLGLSQMSARTFREVYEDALKYHQLYMFEELNILLTYVDDFLLRKKQSLSSKIKEALFGA